MHAASLTAGAFPCAPHRRGQVLQASINETTIIPFISQQLKNIDLALALAKRANLPGAEGLIGQQFEQFFSMGQYKEAAEAAANSPQVSLDPLSILLRHYGPCLYCIDLLPCTAAGHTHTSCCHARPQCWLCCGWC
jgi:hypothetical protein